MRSSGRGDPPLLISLRFQSNIDWGRVMNALEKDLNTPLETRSFSGLP